MTQMRLFFFRFQTDFLRCPCSLFRQNIYIPLIYGYCKLEMRNVSSQIIYNFMVYICPMFDRSLYYLIKCAKQKNKLIGIIVETRFSEHIYNNLAKMYAFAI